MNNNNNNNDASEFDYVIVTGTTGGVGAYRTPPLWMKEGDVVEVEVSGIGVLRNPVKDEVAATATRAA